MNECCNLGYSGKGRWNALRKRKVSSFFLEVAVLLVERMSTGRLFHARGADTLNAHSLNFSLVRGMNSCSLLADRRTVRRVLSPETVCNNFDM